MMNLWQKAARAPSWAAKHPLLMISAFLLACLGPFVTKAIHMDDPLFVWSAEWIQTHPGDFFGFDVNWYGVTTPMAGTNQNPPLTSYVLAAVASLFGWKEFVLHGTVMLMAFAAAAGIYQLARNWCARPLLATLAAMVTPVFLVSSTTLMCDVPMVALWIWALVIWENALKSGNVARLWMAAALAGLAVLTKYSALTLLPLLPILAVLRTRRIGAWLLALALPVAMFVAFEFGTAKIYGQGLFSAAGDYAAAHRSTFEGGWSSKGIVGLAFTGGCLLPLLFFAPLLWSRRALVGGALACGLMLVALKWCGKLGPLELSADGRLRWDTLLQSGLCVVGGLHLLLLAGAALWRERDPVTVVLALWIFSGLLFAIVLNWTVSARSLLPIVPCAAILAVRRLERKEPRPELLLQLPWPLIPSLAISLAVVAADFQLANSARTAARQIASQYTSGRSLWFQGHWGFQYYVQKLGAQPVDFVRTTLQPGDILIVPANNSNLSWPAPADAELIETKEFPVCSWMSTMQADAGAGFHAADKGPLPFALGTIPPEKYSVLRILRPFRFGLSPAMTSGHSAAGAAEFEARLRSNPDDVEAHIQLALLLDHEGRTGEAVKHYYEALRVAPDNLSALNNLAWILAANPRPELRNGEQAIRLATRAVELSRRKQPILLGTLAAAYAETGQFAKAAETAENARALALEARQQETAERNAKLLELYRAGKTAHDAP